MIWSIIKYKAIHFLFILSFLYNMVQIQCHVSKQIYRKRDIYVEYNNTRKR
jgi:hypothetical protein